MNIKTETEHCDILSAFDLSNDEVDGFEYLEDSSGSFFRHDGSVYDLGEFMHPHLRELSEWEGFYPESFDSGVLFKYDDNDETLTIGHCTY